MKDATQKVITSFGHELTVFKHDYISQQIIKHGCFERFTLQAIDNILGLIKPRISLDIGANLGNHAMIIASKSHQLLAFEPNPNVYQLLKQNLVANEFIQAQSFNIGLSSESAHHTLIIKDPDNLGSASLEMNHGTDQQHSESLNIRLEAGDTFLEKTLTDEKRYNAIDFIKIDVEGHELKVLKGLEKTIQDSQPLIFMEWNSTTVREGFRQQNLFDTLFNNYHVYGLSHHLDINVYRKKSFGRLIRTIKKLMTPKHWSLIPFIFNNNYKNIVLIPKRYRELTTQIPIIR